MQRTLKRSFTDIAFLDQLSGPDSERRHHAVWSLLLPLKQGNAGWLAATVRLDWRDTGMTRYPTTNPAGGATADRGRFAHSRTGPVHAIAAISSAPRRSAQLTIDRPRVMLSLASIESAGSSGAAEQRSSGRWRKIRRGLGQHAVAACSKSSLLLSDHQSWSLLDLQKCCQRRARASQHPVHLKLIPDNQLA